MLKFLCMLCLAVCLLFAAPALAADSETIENTGFLSVQSNPSAADVYVNGIYSGKTPLTLSDLHGGKYTVKVVKAGYGVYTAENINVNTGKGAATASVSADLFKDNTAGGLIVYATPAGTSVYLDDEFAGKIPKGNAIPLELTQIAPGQHTIRLEATGYETVTKKNYDITAGATETLKVDLVAAAPEETAAPTVGETTAPAAETTTPAPAPTQGPAPLAALLFGIAGAGLLLRRL